jgi:hypothetical protein
MTITWGKWKRLHPDTVILSRDEGPEDEGLDPSLVSIYDRDPFVGYADDINRGEFFFPVNEERMDDRLRPGDKVFAVQVGESHKAYALSNVSDWVLNDVVAGEAIVIVGRTNGPTGAAYFNAAEGRELSFRINDGSVEDVETGSKWDDSGLAVSGPMSGAQLRPVPSRTSFWFSLVGALPSIELYKPD